MTDEKIKVQWKRNARGYYEYAIDIPNGEDKAQLRKAMDISTDLDKAIDAAIVENMKRKHENEAKKKAAAAAKKAEKKKTKGGTDQ